jgi:glycosyltransferase involved in cell wall biosynthesis
MIISVITPIFNHESYLADYFQGLLNQKTIDIELILIDDNSSDNSFLIANNFIIKNSSKFKKVTLIKNKINVGLRKNLNVGINMAIGDIFIFYASDDYMLPKKLDLIISIYNKNPNISFTFSDFFLKRNDKIVYKKIVFNKNRSLFLQLFEKGNFISAPTITYRREVIKKIGNFDDNFIAEDYDYLLRASYHFNSHYIPEAYDVYRYNNVSYSNSKFYKDHIFQQIITKRSEYKVLFKIPNKQLLIALYNDGVKELLRMILYNDFRTFVNGLDKIISTIKFNYNCPFSCLKYFFLLIFVQVFLVIKPFFYSFKKILLFLRG